MLFYRNTISIKSMKTYSITIIFKIVYACQKVFSSLGFEEYLVDLAPDAGWLLLKITQRFPGYSLTPQLFKPCWIGRRVEHGVLDVAVAEIVLNEPGVGSLIGQGETTGVAKHVRMGGKRQSGNLSILFDRQPGGFPTQWLASVAQEKIVRLRLHLRADCQPGPDRLQFVRPERMRRAEPFFHPRNMQDAAFGIHL